MVKQERNNNRSFEKNRSSEETKTRIFSPNKHLTVIELTPPATKKLTAKELNRKPSRYELLQVQVMFSKKDYINEEENKCLIQWHQRNMIHSDFYRLNFLLTEREKNDSFNTSNEDDSKILKDYDRREYGDSPYNLLWRVQYYEARFLKELREKKSYYKY
jgi:hypothetical protein